MSTPSVIVSSAVEGDLDEVPRQGSGRTVGAGYTARLIEFVSDPDGGWRPGVAASSAGSLQRCIVRLREFV